MKQNRINVITKISGILSFIFFVSCSKDSSTIISTTKNNDTTPLFTKSSPVTDIEGNTYQTIKIGNQIWMAENLRTSKYRNGSTIVLTTDKYSWSEIYTMPTKTGRYCYYNNNADSAKIYGYLYNWYVITDTRNVAPEGWHVATKADWDTLSNRLQPKKFYYGGFLKEKGTLHWKFPNSAATNSTGFSALPCGYRFVDGEFRDINLSATWWAYTSTPADSRELNYNDSSLTTGYCAPQYGYAIRCVKD